MSALSHYTWESALGTLSDEDKAQLEEASRPQRMRQLSQMRSETEIETLKYLGNQLNIPVLTQFEANPDAANTLPLRLIHHYHCLPIQSPESAPDSLYLITVWPPDPAMKKWIYAVSGKRPEWFLGPSEMVVDTINHVFGVGSGSLEDSELDDLTDTDDADDSENENAAIIRFINEIILKAIEERATDIHFEPQKETLQIRYRIDGQLDPVRLPDNLVQFQSAIISRLKIMARLNISERRRPQDGRISFDHGNDSLDIRISTLPTMYGESVSLRLLSQTNRPLTVQELGLLPDDEALLTRTARKPHGIILVTGPTGSGKSTTLTAVIRKIQSPERRIITVEDPVEYEVPGINQTQVQSEIGLDFAAALRTVLRQDPDVIMVGEIRDRETADIGIRASLTGHLVLSTLHTNDSAGALTRLIDMGIEPFLIASSVALIIAQRLVRKLNRQHAVMANYEPEFIETCLRSLNVPFSEIENKNKLLMPGVDSDHRSAGFYGRIGVFEVLSVSERIHEMIVEKATARTIRQEAIQKGMRTLQGSAWEQCKRGLTTLPEIMRLAESIEEADD